MFYDYAPVHTTPPPKSDGDELTEILEFKAQPGSESCTGCAGEPFLTTAEADILMRRVGGDYMQRGITFVNEITDLESRQTELMPADVVPPAAFATTLYTIRTTPRASTDATVLACPGKNTAPGKWEGLTRHRLSSKIALMHQFASALDALHTAGYAHLNVSLESMMIESDTPPRGFLSELGVAAACPKVAGGGPRMWFSRVARGKILFRAPETFFEHTSEKAMPDCSEEAAEQPIYTFSTAGDVWSLGVAFLMILTESSVFRIARCRPYLSLRGAKRIAVLEATGSTGEELQREILTECVRWQSYRLFGVAASAGRGISQSDIEAGNIRRRMNISVMLGGAVDRGILGRRDAMSFRDLLVGMMNPHAPDRITASDVASHEAFRRSQEWASRWMGRAIASPVDTGRQLAPIGGWTQAKDQAVVSALRSAVHSSSISHLPAESLFVAFDCAARTVAGISPPEPAILVTKAAIAAVRVGLGLYDMAPSIAAFGPSIASESSDTRIMQPYVVEYLEGHLRREDYFYELAADSAGLLVAAFHLLIDRESVESEAFRNAYLTLDTVSFVRNTLGPASEKDGRLRARSGDSIRTVYELVRAHDHIY